MYLCRLSSFQEETEGQKVTDFPADGTDVLQCRHHSQLPVISEAACAGYHVGVDLTSDLFPVQHADHEELLQSTIPDSLEESAFLDGASNFQILSKIVLPLSKPILATLSLFYAVGRWNSYADNMYYTKSANLKLIQYKLYQLVASAAEAQDVSPWQIPAVRSSPLPKYYRQQVSCL